MGNDIYDFLIHYIRYLRNCQLYDRKKQTPDTSYVLADWLTDYIKVNWNTK